MPRKAKASTTTVMVKKTAAAPRKRRVTAAPRRAPATVVRRRVRKTLGGHGDYNLRDAPTSQYIGEGFRRVGEFIPKLLGFGDYMSPAFKVSSNSIMDAMTSNGPPNMQSTVNRSHIIRHREFLGDIISSETAGEFQIAKYPLNPGLSRTFPWLSALAQNFEQYRINGMVWEFKSTSGDAVSNTNAALGTVIMATEYNAANQAPFSNKQQMENHEFASSCKPSWSMLHPIECKRSQTPVSELYVRLNDDIPDNADIRMYDLGNFYIATVGQQGTSVNLGELWVTYELEFFKPQLESSNGAGILSDLFENSQGIDNGHIFGTFTNDALQPGSSLGLTLDKIVSNSVYYPTEIQEGSFLQLYYCVGGTATVSYGGITCTNCEVLDSWITGGGINSGTALTSADGTASSLLIIGNVIRITAPQAVVTYAGPGLPSSPTFCQLWVTQLNGNQTADMTGSSTGLTKKKHSDSDLVKDFQHLALEFKDGDKMTHPPNPANSSKWVTTSRTPPKRAPFHRIGR